MIKVISKFMPGNIVRNVSPFGIPSETNVRFFPYGSCCSHIAYTTAVGRGTCKRTMIAVVDKDDDLPQQCHEDTTKKHPKWIMNKIRQMIKVSH